ncbi:hypothetical protein NPIL_287011 [Nephila pilipes]|uniref:RNA-directed DNA polymerase from mobile element jockey n=1 Tax=Nephila pilipes TaxID=299642 RepID=A0A8X6R6N3_NEPPI|nr:hypothetical protein NPIL_287011 [Nephila pilipes]
MWYLLGLKILYSYNTVIRPVLEYASPIWTPTSTSAKQKLDSVQQKASKIIIGVVSSINNKDLDRLKRVSTLQYDKEIRRNIQMGHSSLDYLPEPIIPKMPPGNPRFCLDLLQPSSKKEDPKVLKQKDLDTINLLLKAVAYTDGSSDKSLNR